MPEAPSISGRQGGGSDWPERPSLQRELSSRLRGPDPAPALTPLGLRLFSASCCLPWQPAQSRDLTASSLPCPLGPEAQGPGGKKDVADQKVQRRKEAAVEDGKWPDHFPIPGFNCLTCKTGLVTPHLTLERH